MAPSAVPTSSSVLTAIGVGAIKKLERLFLPAGPDHVRQFEDTAAGADRVRRRIHHRLEGAVHRADTGGAADYAALHRAVEAVHLRHHARRGQIGGPSKQDAVTASQGIKWRTRTRSS